MHRTRSCLLVLPFALAVAAACSKEEPAVKATPVVARTPDPWFLRADEHCGFDSTATHADPQGLVREFVQRDVQGDFLKKDPWLDTAVECPGHEGTKDGYRMVADAEVVGGRTFGDSARVGVRYTLVGSADANGFRPDMRVVTETVTVNRSRFGWRMSTPSPTAHVFVDVAKKRQAFTSADQWAIDASLTQLRRLQPKR